MQKNVGTVDAIVRITLGLLGLAYGIGRMGRRPYRTPWFLMVMSAMKVAEGMTRFCPMLYALGVNTRNQAGMQMTMGKMKEAGAKAIGQITPAGKQQETKLTPEDRQLEQEVQQFVAARTGQESAKKHASEMYSQDEHLYPTYS
jgi:hypothetical protein